MVRARLLELAAKSRSQVKAVETVRAEAVELTLNPECRLGQSQMKVESLLILQERATTEVSASRLMAGVMIRRRQQRP